MPADPTQNSEHSQSGKSTSSQDVDAPEQQGVPQAGAAEAAELEALVNRGMRSSRTVLLLVVAGILVLVGALLYWEKVDLYPAGKGQWLNFGSEYLPVVVENQTRKENAAYALKPGVDLPPQAPFWPEVLYRKLRLDLYLLGGAIFVLCWILIRIEGAKSVRNDLLTLRAMGREIEKLRQRVQELEELRGTDHIENKGKK